MFGQRPEDQSRDGHAALFAGVGAIGKQANEPRLARARSRLLAFLSAESAAVTVDFIVLTATALTIGLSMATLIGDGAMAEADDINKCMRRAGNQLSKDISYEKQLARMQKRCAKL